MKTVYQVSCTELRKLVTDYICKEAGLCYLDPNDVQFVELEDGSIIAEMKAGDNE